LASCTTTKKNRQTQLVLQKKGTLFEVLSISLMTDRFNNGDKLNDLNYGRTKNAGKLRGFSRETSKEFKKK
jgi:alpha-amylase